MAKIPIVPVSMDSIAQHGLKMVLYGAPKVGKTFLLKSLTGKTLLIDSEGGIDTLRGETNIQCISLLNNLESLPDVLEYCQTCPHENIVLDSATVLYSKTLQWFSRHSNNGDLPTQRNYAEAQSRILNLIQNLFSLTEKGKNIILTFWEMTSDYGNPDGSVYQKVVPSITSKQKMPSEIVGLSDIIGRLVVKTDSEGKRFRVLELAPTLTSLVGNRYNIEVDKENPDLQKLIDYCKSQQKTTNKLTEEKEK